MQILRAAVFFGGEEDLNQPSRTGKLAIYLFLYIPVVWAAMLLAQSLDGGLPDIIANLTAAMEHPFHIHWTDRSLVTILACTGAYIMGIFALGVYVNFKHIVDLVGFWFEPGGQKRFNVKGVLMNAGRKSTT